MTDFTRVCSPNNHGGWQELLENKSMHERNGSFLMYGRGGMLFAGAADTRTRSMSRHRRECSAARWKERQQNQHTRTGVSFAPPCHSASIATLLTRPPRSRQFCPSLMVVDGIRRCCRLGVRGILTAVLSIWDNEAAPKSRSSYHLDRRGGA